MGAHMKSTVFTLSISGNIWKNVLRRVTIIPSSASFLWKAEVGGGGGPPINI